MADALKNQYEPDTVSAPGETLQETLETLGMTADELAEQIGCPTSVITQILVGDAAITSELACQLERVLGVPARFWLNREQQYRQTQTNQTPSPLVLDATGHPVG